MSIATDLRERPSGRSVRPLALAAACLALLLAPSAASAADAPLATTGDSSPGAESWIRALEGSVVPGTFKLTECRFDYVEESDHDPTAANPYADGAAAPCEQSFVEIGSGAAPRAVSAIAEPLEPDTTYRYRLVAGNALGTSFGADRTFATGSAPSDSCPNADRRAEQGIVALLLPGCMALEMVSPPKKFGYPARFPFVSANGDRVAFFTSAALGEDPSSSPLGGALYLADRGGSSWTSQITIPRLDPPLSTPWRSQDRVSFTPDFSRWFGIAASERQSQQGIALAYEAGTGGFFRPLAEPLVPHTINVNGGERFAYVVPRDSSSQGVSADRSHLYFKPGGDATYLVGDPPFSNAAGAEPAKVYLLRSAAGGEPAPLELLQRDRDAKVWGGNCGARLGGIGEVPNGSPPNGERNQGAVSADGSRTYFSARASQPQNGDCNDANKLRILERVETPSGPQIVPLFTSECFRPALPDPPGPCSAADGDDLYQGASLDQTKVYFTTNRQLVDTDTDGTSAQCSVDAAVAGCDLYLFDRTRPAGERLLQVSAGEDATPGSGANLYNGITAISADGSHVYFVAAGVLTDDPNPVGEVAQAGSPNLYLWEAGSGDTKFIGTLDPGDAISSSQGSGLWGGQGTWQNNAYPVPVTGTDAEGNRVGGDGHILAFLSKAELTAKDGDGSHLDAYRYDANAGELECVSCHSASSATLPDDAPFDLDHRGQEGTLGTDFAENHRWVSEDGQVVAFRTAQPLVPGDFDGAEDFYLWREGELVRLPGDAFVIQTLLDDGAFLSHDGSTVAFTTATPLLPQDGDTAADVYVARVGGGYPEPPPPNLCQGEECRGQPSTEPQFSGAGSRVFVAPVPRPSPNSCGLISKKAQRKRVAARKAARRGQTKRARTLRRQANNLKRRAKRCNRRQGR